MAKRFDFKALNEGEFLDFDEVNKKIAPKKSEL